MTWVSPTAQLPAGLVAAHSAFSGNPHAPLAVFDNFLYGVVYQPVLARQVLKDGAVKAADAAAKGAKPQMAAAVFHRRKHDVVGQSVVADKCLPFSPVVAAYPAHGAEPQIAVAVLHHGSHLVVDQSVGRGEIGKGGLVVDCAVAADAAVGGNPQVAGVVLQ